MSQITQSGQISVDGAIYLRAQGVRSHVQRPMDARLPSSALVGECLEGEREGQPGKVLVFYPGANGRDQKRWLSTLRGVSVRAGDHVVLLQPGNWPYPVVAGAF